MVRTTRVGDEEQGLYRALGWASEDERGALDAEISLDIARTWALPSSRRLCGGVLNGIEVGV